MVDHNVLRTHLQYTAWASRRIVEAAAQLTGEELARDFGTADKSVLGTLVHVYAADRIWLERMRGEVRGTFISDADHSLSVLQNDWPALHENWLRWLDGVADATAKKAYQDLAGKPHETPVWQVLLHVVNHGTHHRGQASGMMRTMGKTPPPLDLIAYYRQVS